MVDLNAVMAQLSRSRPVFHSEADFQHALAWQLQVQHPSMSVRLEIRSPHLPVRGYLDIWLAEGAERVAIELKYKTRALKALVEGEPFDLLNQSAQDFGRYDTLKDLQRVEKLVAAVPNATGFVLLLTNDSSSWTESLRPDSADAAFRLHDARVVTGELVWGAGASDNTRKGREAALALSGRYQVNWQDYARVSDHPLGRFRYAVFPVLRHTSATELGTPV